MSTNLLDYLSRRHHEPVSQPTKTGYFLTISRQTGCEATEIAVELIKIFRKEDQKWHMINKEILDKSAKKLNLDREKLNHDFITSRGTVMDEVIKSLSMRYYVNDRKIRKTISDVVRYEAKKGNVIIIGRAGVVSTGDIKGGLHIRLVAPFDWRVENLMKKRNMPREQMEKYVLESDRKRVLFLERFCGKKIQDVCFDLTINRASFSQKQTAGFILNAMNIKGLL